MTAIDVKNRKPAIIENEIASLNLLILKRNVWLNKPENGHKTTYKAVCIDTMQMVEKLHELKRELTEVNK